MEVDRPLLGRERFESIKESLSDGTEFWSARRLAGLLDYEWRYFRVVIEKAEAMAVSLKMNPKDHFVVYNKKIILGLGSARQAEHQITDFQLDRIACYFIAQNGNPAIPAIAQAKAYFTLQTLKQERQDDEFASLPPEHQRLRKRNDLKAHNVELSQTAKQSGVSDFNAFHGSGHKGMYGGKSVGEVKIKKGIEKGALLDHVGTSELAAHDLRVTLTNDKLKQQSVKGQQEAQTAHKTVGEHVRRTVIDSLGVAPEDLPAETESIAQLERRIQNDQKKISPPAEKPLRIDAPLSMALGAIAKAQPPKKDDSWDIPF